MTRAIGAIRGCAAAALILTALIGGAAAHEGGLNAAAALDPKSGSAVSGTLKLDQRGDAVHLQGTLTGLTPGRHGIHVHVNGDCESPDARSAGGSFNPNGVRRTGASPTARAPGMLGEIVANPSGTAVVDMTVQGLSIAIMGKNSIIDRSIVVFSVPDDDSEPDGNSGARIACGAIEQSMPRM